jgi:hypothetical protein
MSMAHILPFRSAAAQAEPERAPGGGPATQAGAQIIIFPGVRRERHADQPQARASRRREKARPKRDRLELPD